ncbi:hypothetical protein D3C85_1568080 [compost metagenome]
MLYPVLIWLINKMKPFSASWSLREDEVTRAWLLGVQVLNAVAIEGRGCNGGTV